MAGLFSYAFMIPPFFTAEKNLRPSGAKSRKPAYMDAYAMSYADQEKLLGASTDDIVATHLSMYVANVVDARVYQGGHSENPVPFAGFVDVIHH